MHHHDTSLHSGTKRARGLGSAHEGTGHFWLQRVSALALIPLSVWLMVELVGSFLGSDRATAALWFRHPLHALAMLLFVLAIALHARLGMQTIIEDYVHCEAKKIALLLVNNAAMLLFTLAGVIAIARIHLIGI